MMSLFRDPAQLSGADARKCRPRSVEWSPARFACAVFTHIECAVRYWPTEREGPFNPRMLEDAFPMRDVAGSGRALELNIDSPIRAWILRSGGARTVACITSASDAHTTHASGRQLLRSNGNGRALRLPPSRHPEDFWIR
jgi:histidinol-phosphatase (PHP family)